MIGKRTFLAVMVFGVFAGLAQSTLLSVHDIQYTTDVSGNSPYNGQTVDCAGGIVINIWIGGQTKLTIYDPANPDGWGGVIIKTTGSEFASIQVGSWVSLANVLVEEKSGNTQLTFGAASGITVVSMGNTLPGGVVVTDGSFSEKYESMRVSVSNVQITAMNLGRYSDNYNLQNTNGNYWAGDYMNIEAGGIYHPFVSVGASFNSVSGIIEHKISSGWNYYQLLTTETADFVIPEPATLMLLFAGATFLRKPK
jgi:hypothetical protein